MASLWDPAQGNFLYLSGDIFNFDTVFLDYSKYKNPIPRQIVEDLIERIQITLLIGIPDEVFPTLHHTRFEKDGFTDKYRFALTLWEKRLTNFLAHTKGTHFHIM